MNRFFSIFALLCFTGVIASACAAPADETSDDGNTGDEADVTEAPTAAAAVERAQAWADAKLHYCWAPNGKPDPNPACPSTCTRTSNAAWDPYRSDCSGLVSWAWGLPAPGRTTSMFAPYKKDITQVIQASDLQPGDAVNNSHHIMLFKKWVTAGSRALFLEEPGCSSKTPYAHEVTSNVTISGSSITLAWSGDTFTAIRYTMLQRSASTSDASAPSDDGDQETTQGPTPSSGDDTAKSKDGSKWQPDPQSDEEAAATEAAAEKTIHARSTRTTTGDVASSGCSATRPGHHSSPATAPLLAMAGLSLAFGRRARKRR